MAAKTDLLPSCLLLFTAYRKDWYLWCIDGVTGLALGGVGCARSGRSVGRWFTLGAGCFGVLDGVC